ncbi:MAG TPA: hypothetical protein VEH62_05790 [Gemmatimonadales bacterium]|nr:hypothetical protein [Gemmatimonadales bacterium]
MVALLLSACASWQGRQHVLDGPLDPRDQVRLWVRGHGHQVHGVRVQRDSVIAVPFIRPPDCDSCAIRVARAAVDSVQVRATDWRASVFAAILWAPVVYLFYTLSQIPRD